MRNSNRQRSKAPTKPASSGKDSQNMRSRPTKKVSSTASRPLRGSTKNQFKTDIQKTTITEEADVKCGKENASDSDSDIIIETDSDSDGSPSGGKMISHTRSTECEPFSSTPVNKGTKRAGQIMSINRRRKCKQLIKNAKVSLLKSKGPRRRLSIIKEAENEQSDSEWESLSEMEVLDGDGNHTDRDGCALDGALTVNVNEGGEEAEGPHSQIPLQEQLEKTIAAGSARNNLSVSNVKSIIWTVLTHDLVKEMLKTRLQACDGEGGDGNVIEPKLTRSKMKEVLEKGKDARLWPVSPVQLGQASTAGPSILDVEFAEEEDEEDDEYEPSKDVAELESDDESVASSRVSEIGSPFPLNSPLLRAPSTPTTPRPPAVYTELSQCSIVPQVSSDAITPSSLSDGVVQSQITVTPMGPPAGVPPPAHCTRQRLVFRSPEKQNREQPEEDGIAGRTRSKLPLTTTSLYDIEEAFVAPDITPDMYDTMYDDSDWQEFLKNLHKLGASSTDTDVHNETTELGEEDDPEFNYSAEVEEAEPDAEEARFGGAFRVSRKELHGLLEELEDLFNEDDCSMIGLRTNLASAHQNAALLAKKPTEAMDQVEKLQIPSNAQKPVPPNAQEPAPPNAQKPPPVMDLAGAYPLVLDRQVKLIEEHMRKHIQLTAQMYVLAQGSDSCHPMADTCRKLLVELDQFRSVSPVGPQSTFNACNLAGALDIINRDIDWASYRQEERQLPQEINVDEPAGSDSSTTSFATAAPEGSCEVAAGKSSGKTKAGERGKKTNSTVTATGRKDFMQHVHRCYRRLALLRIQRDVMLTSRVFLYPSLLPKKALLPLHIARNIDNNLFSPGEDGLLVLGKEQFKHMKRRNWSVYTAIHQYMMPCRSKRQMASRFRRGKVKTSDIIERYKRTGEVPRAPETAEEFSVEMMKAPCEQPENVVPKWVRVQKRYLRLRKRGQDRQEKRNRERAECLEKLAEERRQQEQALEEERTQEELATQHPLTDTEDSAEERPNQQKNGNDSSSEPSAKVARMDFRPEQPVGALMPCQEVTSPLSLTSPVNSRPSTLRTSQGLYISLDLADLAKVRQALAKSHVMVIGEGGEQKVVDMEQYLMSNPISGDDDVHRVLSSLSGQAGSSETTSLQTQGSDENADQREETEGGNSECPDGVRTEGDNMSCGAGNSKAQQPCESPLQTCDEADEAKWENCICAEEETPLSGQGSTSWQDSSALETHAGEQHAEKVRTVQDSSGRRIGACKKKNSNRESEFCEGKSRSKDTMDSAEYAEDYSALPCVKEEFLRDQGRNDSVSPSDDENCSLVASASGDESDRSWRDGITWEDDPTRTGVSEQGSIHKVQAKDQAHCERDSLVMESDVCSENDHSVESQNCNQQSPSTMDEEETAAQMKDQQVPNNMRATTNLEVRATDGSVHSRKTSEEQHSDKNKTQSVQSAESSAAVCHTSPSVHIGLIYHVHIQRDDSEIMRDIIHTADRGKYFLPQKLSPYRSCHKQLNVMQDTVRSTLGHAAKCCWCDNNNNKNNSNYNNCTMYEDLESLKSSGSAVSSQGKLMKAGVFVTIIVSMMYGADYTHSHNTEDQAESPTSTTPDGKEDDRLEQGEIRNPGETLHERSASQASDDLVSTTSDFEDVGYGQNSSGTLMSYFSVSGGDLQGSSSSMHVDSSCVAGHSSPDHLSLVDQSSERLSALPEILLAHSSGSALTMPAPFSQDEEDLTSVSSSSLFRLAGRDRFHSDPMSGSEVSSSDRSPHDDELVQHSRDDMNMHISRDRMLQCPTTSQATAECTEGHASSRPPALPQASQGSSLCLESSAVVASGPDSCSAVVSSSSGLQVPVVKNMSWSNVSSVGSAVDVGGVHTMSAQASGFSQGSFTEQDLYSGLNVFTSDTSRGASIVSECPSTSTGTLIENLTQESVMLFGDSAGLSVTDQGHAASSFTVVSSSDLSSIDFEDGEKVCLQSSFKEQANSVCEVSASNWDSSHGQKSGEDGYKETNGDSRTTALTQAADEGEIQQNHSSIDEQNRQTLYRLIESGRNATEDPGYRKVGVIDWTVNMAAETEQSIEGTVTTAALRDAGQGTGDVTVEKEKSPVKQLSYMQSMNEQSPPPSSALSLDEERLSLVESSVQNPVDMSASADPHPSFTVPSEDSETPTMLSCLGLVSTKHVDSTQSHAPTEQRTSDTDFDSPGRSARLIATLTPLCSSPASSPTTYTLRYTGEKSPARSSGFLRPLVPKPGPVTYPTPPRVPRVTRGSPKKMQLQKQVRAILPKGYSYELKMNSPTKAAARTLKKKATLFCQRSPNKPLLPKDPSMMQTQMSTRHHGTNLSSTTSPLLPWSRKGRGRKRSRTKTKTKEAVAAVSGRKTPAQPKGHEERSQEESDETGSEVEDVATMSQDDSQNEEEAGEAEDDSTYLQDLMAASTTIGFNPYIKTTPDKDGHCSKQEIRRQQKLSLLSSDVVETDPRKDDRDLAYAQSYLNKVKVAMQKDPATYTQFMDTLRQFETTQASPIEVYESLSGLLVNYPELLEDFAAFLQPGQALQTRCHVSNQLIHDMRAFLRKLELHYGLKGARYAKILRTLGKWDSKNKSSSHLREQLMPLLGTLPQHLHDDFGRFFPDIKPAESHMEPEDFEEIKLRDSDDEGNRSPDDFEDITFPEENDPYRTRRCPCVCHKGSLTKRKQKEKYTHCYNCCVKVVDGQLYYQPSNVTTRRPVSATFYDPISMPVPSDLPPPSARSRGIFHRSTVLEEADDDDMEDDMELEEDDAHVDTEDDKGTEDEKPETEEDDEKPDTDEDEEEDEDDEEDIEEEEDEGEMTEEEGKGTPAKQPRAPGDKEAVPSQKTVSLSSKQTAQPSSQDPAAQQPSPQQVSRRQDQQTCQQTKAQQAPDQQPSDHQSVASLSQQPLPQQPLVQKPAVQHPLLQHAVSPQMLAHHPVAQELLAQRPVAAQSVTPQQVGCGVEEVLHQPLTSRRPASPSQPLPALTALPAMAALQRSKIGLPKPGASNMRMRKRILSMRPGRQVSASMQSLTPDPGQGQEVDSASDRQSPGAGQGLASALNPLLLPQPGAATTWKSPRILPNKGAHGTVSVVGPDNTVIMFNSSIPTPALGETLPSLHEQRAFFPLPVNHRASVGEARTGLVTMLEKEDKPEEDKSPLPTITSPHKNMQRGSFAGLLQGVQSLDHSQPSVSSPSPQPSSAGDPVDQTPVTATTSVPLMSEDTLGALFEEMREGQASSSTPLPFDLNSNSSMSLLSKIMQYTESPQEEAVPSKNSVDDPSLTLGPLDLSLSSHPPPPPADHPSASHEQVQWTSEQDRLILDMVRDHGASASTCHQIASRLPGVTSSQVSEHMSTLMGFLEVSGEEAVEKAGL